VKRLSDLHLHKEALYPPAPIPRQAITESPDGLDYGFDAPGLLDLKISHPGIIAAVVLKAAMALVNVARTGYTHALGCGQLLACKDPGVRRRPQSCGSLVDSKGELGCPGSRVFGGDGKITGTGVGVADEG